VFPPTRWPLEHPRQTFQRVLFPLGDLDGVDSKLGGQLIQGLRAFERFKATLALKHCCAACGRFPSHPLFALLLPPTLTSTAVQKTGNTIK